METLTSQTRSLQQQYGRGCLHWLRAVSTIRKHFQHLNIDVLVQVHTLFKSALASLDVELTAYVDGNMRRQAQWRLLQSVFLKDLVTLEAQLYQYHAHKASKRSSADDEASTSRVVDLDEDDAFGAGDNNLQRQKDLLLMNMAQAIQFLEGELRGVLQYFIGADTHRIRHLLLPLSDSAAATSAPFSFPTLKIAPFDPMFLCERLPLLFAAASPQTLSPTPSRAAGIPIVTLPDLLSAYLALHTGFLDLLRETGQASLAMQMTQHVVLSLGTVVSFLSLINQAVRMPSQRAAAPDADADDDGDEVNDAASAPSSAENAAECSRVLSVLLHALRRHRAVTAFKLTVLEQQFAQQAPREADAAADLSLFRPFEIDGYEEGQRRISGLGQSYIDLDNAIREHLRRGATSATRASPASGDWMARLQLTRALCGELAALHDWTHARSVATPLTRELFTALEITPYNHAQSLFPARRPARSATEVRVSWVVTSDADRVEVADALLALYELQSRACQHLLHPKGAAPPGPSHEALQLEAVRCKYQAGLLALLWAANMPETARRLLESAEESQRALRPLLRQRWQQAAATASHGAEADEVFESTLLCGDVCFHLGLAYFQGGGLQDAVDATKDALQCFDEAAAVLQALGRTAPLGPCAPSAAVEATDDDAAQVQLRRRHCHSQLLWVHTALGSEVDARQALQALTSLQQDADETARLCVMIHQRLGVDVRAWLTAPAPAAVAVTATVPPRDQAAPPAAISSSASSTVTQRRPPRTAGGASPAAATGSDRSPSVPQSSSVAAETLSPLERQKKVDELEARLRRLEPLDGNFVLSVAILSLVGLCVAYALLRFFGWDAALFGDAVDEGALFDL